MPSVTLLAAALLLPALAALTLIALGVRGRTRPTPPTCHRCRFNVSAQWPSAPSSPALHTPPAPPLSTPRCPECGLELTPARVLHSRRVRRPRLILASSLALLLTLSPVALFLTRYAWSPAALKLWPTPLLRLFLWNPHRSTLSAGDLLATELARRISTGTIPKPTALSIIDQIIDRRDRDTLSFRPTLYTIIDAAEDADLLDSSRLRRARLDPLVIKSNLTSTVRQGGMIDFSAHTITSPPYAIPVLRSQETIGLSQPHFEIDGVHFDVRTHGGYSPDGNLQLSWFLGAPEGPYTSWYDVVRSYNYDYDPAENIAYLGQMREFLQLPRGITPGEHTAHVTLELLYLSKAQLRTLSLLTTGGLSVVDLPKRYQAAASRIVTLDLPIKVHSESDPIVSFVRPEDPIGTRSQLWLPKSVRWEDVRSLIVNCEIVPTLDPEAKYLFRVDTIDTSGRVLQRIHEPQAIGSKDNYYFESTLRIETNHRTPILLKLTPAVSLAETLGVSHILDIKALIPIRLPPRPQSRRPPIPHAPASPPTSAPDP